MQPGGSTPIRSSTPISANEQRMANGLQTIAKTQPGGSSSNMYSPMTPAMPYTPISQSMQNRADALQTVASTQPGGSTPMTSYGQSYSSPTQNYSPVQQQPVFREPVLDASQAKNLSSPYGFKAGEFTGLTMSQANAKIEEKKKAIGAQTSSGTSFTFNPETASNANKIVNDAKFKVDSIKAEPWNNTQLKKTNTEATVASYSDQLAKLFDTTDEFNQAMTNPDFQKTMQQYESMGGKVADVAAKIGQPSPYQQNTQTIDQYLGAISTPADQKAFDSLIPEKQVYQDQISFEQSIPEKYKALYFGTPEQIGIQEQKKQQAAETIKILERKAEQEKTNAKAQIELNIQKNNAEMEMDEAEVEQNRLNAKNYITGMLAKLGALNTTGAAPVAIATLEQKYQQQAQKIRSKYKFENKQYEVDLAKKVGDIDITRDEKILAAREDLSKSEEETFKEIFKLQNAADRATFATIQTYTQEFRNQREKFNKEAKAEAEKYAKELAKKAGTYSVAGLSFEQFINKKQNEVQQSFNTQTKKDLIPEFLQTVANSGKISDDLQAVIDGQASLSDFTPSVATKVQREMTRLGIKKDMLPTTSTDTFGELSKADRTKGINYILSNKGTQEDVDKFKTDRGFQAYVMS